MVASRTILLMPCLLIVAACSSEKTELVRLTSPDRATTAVVVQESGGGAAISSTYSVYLSESQGQLGKPSLRATYCGRLALAWKGNKTLVIEYDPECYIKQFVNKWWSKSATERAQPATVEIVLLQRQNKVSAQEPTPQQQQ